MHGPGSIGRDRWLPACTRVDIPARADSRLATRTRMCMCTRAHQSSAAARHLAPRASHRQALRAMISGVRDDLEADVDAFVSRQGAGNAEAPTVSVDELAAYYMRFEPWAEQRRLLSRAGVEFGALRLEVSQSSKAVDRLVLAACDQCDQLREIAILHVRVHNSTLSAVAQRIRARLVELDLTESQGFDDLVRRLAALAALAALP